MLKMPKWWIIIPACSFFRYENTFRLSKPWVFMLRRDAMHRFTTKMRQKCRLQWWKWRIRMPSILSDWRIHVSQWSRVYSWEVQMWWQLTLLRFERWTGLSTTRFRIFEFEDLPHWTVDWTRSRSSVPVSWWGSSKGKSEMATWRWFAPTNSLNWC